MADRISRLYIDTTIDDSNPKNYSIWIKTFLIEFLKKWTKIDFLRMDKYTMLTQTVIKTYLEYNLNIQNNENILNFFDHVDFSIKSGHYNYSFIAVILKIFSYFIDEVFQSEGEVEIKKKFLEGYFVDILEKLIKVNIYAKF
jgi:hypothetical protein